MNNKEYIIEFLLEKDNDYVKKYILTHYPTYKMTINTLEDLNSVRLYFQAYGLSSILKMLIYLKKQSNVYLHKVYVQIGGFKKLIAYNHIECLKNDSNVDIDTESIHMYDYTSSEET